MRALTLTFCFVAATALASSHREAPAISFDPAADNTDLWAWVDSSHATLHVVAAYNPLEEPSGGPNFHKFSDDVLYEVHIARGASSLADVVTYQIRFSTPPVTRVDPANTDAGVPIGGGKEFFLQLAAAPLGGFPTQTYTVTKVANGASTVIASNVKVAPPNIGPQTFAVVTKGQYGSAESSYDDAFAASFVTPMGSAGAEGTVWAGPRDDGFYVDLGGVFDLANLRPQAVDGGSVTNPAQDGVAGYNCHAIVLDIPTTLLTGTGAAPGNTPGNATTLGIWASASRRKVEVRRHDGTVDLDGPWVQVSRLGIPLINEAVIGLQDKDKYNRTHPKDDLTNFGAYFLNPVVVRDAQAVGLYAPGAPLGTITPPISNRTDIIDIINLTNIPSAGAHSITTVGDVLRVDMAATSGFPNGRVLYGGTNVEDPVTDTLLSLVLTKLQAPVSQGAVHNDKVYLSTTPYLALPWEGFREGHGKPTP